TAAVHGLVAGPPGSTACQVPPLHGLMGSSGLVVPSSRSVQRRLAVLAKLPLKQPVTSPQAVCSQARYCAHSVADGSSGSLSLVEHSPSQATPKRSLQPRPPTRH